MPGDVVIDALGPGHNLLLNKSSSLALSLCGHLVYALACMHMRYVALARHDHRLSNCHCTALPWPLKLDMSRSILENRWRSVKVSEIVPALQCSIMKQYTHVLCCQ